MTRSHQTTRTLIAFFDRLKPFALTAATIASLFSAATRCSADVTLTFQGLHDLEPVLDYYNGGYGGTDWFAQCWPTTKTDAQGNNIHNYEPAYGGDANNYGISFSENALAVISGPGGIGDFSNNPSGDNTVALIAPFCDQYGNDGVTMNIWNGFEGSDFTFSYCSLSTPGTVVSIYDAVGGPSGGGNVIAEGALPDNIGQDDNGSNDQWLTFSLPFSGTAYSVYFSAAIGADDLTLTGFSLPMLVQQSVVVVEPAPEASTILIWAVLVPVGCAFCRRRVQSKA